MGEGAGWEGGGDGEGVENGVGAKSLPNTNKLGHSWIFNIRDYEPYGDFQLHGFDIIFLRPGKHVKPHFSVPVDLQNFASSSQ